jgi:hypothetical protein
MLAVRILGGALAWVLGFGLIFGCGKKVEGPPTVPLKGKVQFTKGGKVENLANHSIPIEFQSVEQPEVKAFGEILEDGSFEMRTQIGTVGKPGVVAGKHRVRFNADDSAARFIAPKFLSFESSGLTVTAPSDKVVVLEVWR